MSGIIVIPFRLGPGSATPVKRNRIKFYKWLFTNLFVSEAPRVQVEPLTISFNTIVENSAQLYPELVKRIELGLGMDAIFIDVVDSPDFIIPARAFGHIAHAIQEVLVERRANKRPPLVVILIADLPPEQENFHMQVKRLIEDGRVVLVSNDGGVVSQRTDLGHLNPTNYRQQRRASGNSALDQLQRRMIRRLGHFAHRRPGEEDARCVKQFYDGSECEEALITLIAEHLERHTTSNKNRVIVYHAEVSRWLPEVLLAVQQALGSRLAAWDEVARDPDAFTSAYLDNGDFFLVLPMVDSGGTVTWLLNFWEQKLGLPYPNVLTVLSTEGIPDLMGRRTHPRNGENVEISYFLKVDRDVYSRPQNCPMCQEGRPYSTYEKDDYILLTTGEHWDLANECGWREEQDVPSGRPGLAWVPMYDKIFDQHGAWLAHKVVACLAHAMGSDFPAKPVLVVAPDETGANGLTDFLKVAHTAVNVVRIPSNVLADWRQDSAGARNMLDPANYPVWFRTIRQATHDTMVVTMEEFRVGGGTQNALASIVDGADRRVTCHFAVADFNPRLSTEEKPIHCLYSAQLHSPAENS